MADRVVRGPVDWVVEQWAGWAVERPVDWVVEQRDGHEFVYEVAGGVEGEI